MTALSDVRTFNGKEGFEYMETGVSHATSGAQSGGGSNGAGDFMPMLPFFFASDYSIF